MRQTLLALAASTSVMGSAFAQSNVTIYGLLDEGVGKLNKGTSFLTGLNPALVGFPDVWTIKSTVSSRLGFRGTEDLGDGLKANFVIEHRLAPDIGNTQAGQAGFWGGQSWVGLSHASVGELRLGRQYVPAHYVAVAGDPFGLAYTAAGGYAFDKGGSTFTYAANSIGYKTPSLFGGFTSEVMVGLGEGGTAVNPANNIDRVVSANVIYAKGPVYAGAGFYTVRSSTPVKNEFWVATAAYDLGFVRPIASFSASRVNSANLTHGFTLGLTAPVGAGVLKGIYARLDPSGSNNETDKLGIGYDYFLSKRTNLYANAGMAKTKDKTRASGFDAGIRHVF
jgi:predicted porin